ncbi:MAG: glycosyltransferase [Candidatus Rokubacteria bacterium]|nr:glycosyltransferase [Candidatus Rokubacteria bacterium]
MLEGRSIICFAHDWSGDPTSKTHIMRILAERNRILWVNSIGMRRPAPSGRDLRRLGTKLRRGLEGCMRVGEHLHAWSPLVLPLPGVAGIDRLNTLILTMSLRSLARRLGLVEPILWTFLPNVNRLVGRLGERLVIYHCVDEYTAFSGVPREALARMERDLLAKADLVFTSSEQLCRERQRHNPRTFFVSHGVEVDHFARALEPATVVPDDVKGLPPPVVGFFGLIADWVDLALIRELALARPQWSFVLVGKATTALDPVAGLLNVHVLGQKPYAALPGYCKGFDVGLVPFRINELTLKANPLKLREYLAAGLPVVATDLPEVNRYRGVVRVASDAAGFLAGIEAACADRSPVTDRRRVDAMARESWHARVEELSRLIESAERPRC